MTNRIIDHHVHSNFSPDSNTSIEKIIKRLKKMGINQLMLTDHVDLESPVELFQEIIDYDVYQTHLKDLRCQYDMDILMGIEMGYQPQITKQMKAFVNRYPFDFVICSMHVCSGLDFYYGDFFIGKTQKESYQIYFENVLESVSKYQDYDVYGHLDYIIRYGKYLEKKLNYVDYRDVIDEILKTIITNGKGIELNTSGIRYDLDVMHPNKDILKRYKALGGEIITIGSDAHNENELYQNFEDAKQLLKSLGYKAIAQYKKRMVNFVDL